MIINKNVKCTSCGMCEVVCKQDSIKIKLSAEGYYRPYINNDKCNECGMCEKVCPAYRELMFSPYNGMAFSVFSRNSNTRKESTSGGIAHEISKIHFAKGFGVCGVKYDFINDKAIHNIAKNGSEISEFKGSKYIQSNTVEAFKEIIQTLRDKKYIIFGTPCQIAAIEKYANIVGKREHLVLVDFFCHGTPTYNLWKLYINEAKQRLKAKKINGLNFRDKKYGWHNYTIAIEDSDGLHYSDRNIDKDLFYEMFLGNYCLNGSCYTCKFRTVYSKADIRVGDLWGSKYKNDTKGISGVIAFTDLGQQIISELVDTCIIKTESLETIVEGQMKGDLDIPKARNKILVDLENEKALQKIYSKRVIPIKIKRKIIRVLRG